MPIANSIANFGARQGQNIERRIGNAMAYRNQNNAMAEQKQQQEKAAQMDYMKQGISAIATMPEEQRAQAWQGLRQGAASNFGPDHPLAANMPDYSPEVFQSSLGKFGVQSAQPAQRKTTTIENAYKYMDTLAPDDPRREQVGEYINKISTVGDPQMEELKKLQLQSNIMQQQQNAQLRQSEEARKTEAAALSAQKAQGEIAEKEASRSKAQNMAGQLAASALELLSDDAGLEGYSGVSGNLPTVRPKQKSWEAKLGQIINNLTIENLSLMSGVLSDSDIKILKGAGQALAEGGDINQNRKELQNIINKLESAAGSPITEFNNPTQAEKRKNNRSQSSSGFSMRRID